MQIPDSTKFVLKILTSFKIIWLSAKIIRLACTLQKIIWWIGSSPYSAARMRFTNINMFTQTWAHTGHFHMVITSNLTACNIMHQFMFDHLHPANMFANPPGQWSPLRPYYSLVFKSVFNVFWTRFLKPFKTDCFTAVFLSFRRQLISISVIQIQAWEALFWPIWRLAPSDYFRLVYFNISILFFFWKNNECDWQ